MSTREILTLLLIFMVIPPASASDDTPLLAIYGHLLDHVGQPFGGSGYQLTVMNTRSGEELLVTLEDDHPGRFEFTFVDLGGNAAGRVGDTLAFVLRDTSGSYQLSISPIVLTAEDVSAQVIEVSLALDPCEINDVRPTSILEVGDALTIEGSNFLPSSSVDIGEVRATEVTQVSSESIQIMIPELSDGQYVVRVSFSSGGSCQWVTGVVHSPNLRWGTLKAAYQSHGAGRR